MDATISPASDGGSGPVGDGDPASVSPATASDGGSGGGTNAWAAPSYDPHPITVAGRTFAVIETNGVAEVEASGTGAPSEAGRAGAG